MKPSILPRFALTIGLVVAAGAVHASFTVGTFADPTATSSENFFRFTRLSESTALLEGAWLADGLHLLTPGVSAPDQFDARFEIRNSQDTLGLLATTSGGDFFTEAGYVRFFDSSNNTLLRIDFDSAVLNGNGFAAGFGSGTDDIDMSGAIVEPGWENEHFGFAFTNWTVVDEDDLTMSASFTSSAVPEPGTLGVLTLGLLPLLRRRKSRA